MSDGLNVTEAAAHLGVARSTLYKLLERREVPHRMVGSQPRFSRTALTLWLAGVDDLPRAVGLGEPAPAAAAPAPTAAPTEARHRRTPKVIRQQAAAGRLPALVAASSREAARAR